VGRVASEEILLRLVEGEFENDNLVALLISRTSAMPCGRSSNTS
jgi:hypothetical protein